MIRVCFGTSDVDHDKLDEIFREIASRYAPIALQPHGIIKSPDSSDKETLNLRITSSHLPAPYIVSREEGVAVSLWQSKGICQYARIQESSYTALCSLLGITQWRVLQSNPLLQPHDFLHPPSSQCLFATPDDFQDFALALENPRVCGGCRDFYHCLGADTELIAVIDTLSAIRSASVRTT